MNDYKSGTTAKAANELICNGPTATYRGGHLGMTCKTEKAFNGEIITTVRIGGVLDARFYGKDGERKSAIYLDAVLTAARADSYSI